MKETSWRRSMVKLDWGYWKRVEQGSLDAIKEHEIAIIMEKVMLSEALRQMNKLPTPKDFKEKKKNG